SHQMPEQCHMQTVASNAWSPKGRGVGPRPTPGFSSRLSVPDYLSRQTQPAGGDDVALDLAGPTVDGRRNRAQIGARITGLRRRNRRAGVVDVPVQADDFHARARDALTKLGVVELGDRGLVVRDLVVGLHGNDAVAEHL